MITPTKTLIRIFVLICIFNSILTKEFNSQTALFTPELPQQYSITTQTIYPNKIPEKKNQFKHDSFVPANFALAPEQPQQVQKQQQQLPSKDTQKAIPTSNSDRPDQQQLRKDQSSFKPPSQQVGVFTDKDNQKVYEIVPSEQQFRYQDVKGDIPVKPHSFTPAKIDDSPVVGTNQKSPKEDVGLNLKGTISQNQPPAIKNQPFKPKQIQPEDTQLKTINEGKKTNLLREEPQIKKQQQNKEPIEASQNQDLYKLLPSFQMPAMSQQERIIWIVFTSLFAVTSLVVIFGYTPKLGKKESALKAENEEEMNLK